MAARNITIRFRDFELERIDELVQEMHAGSRSDVVRAGLALLASPAQHSFREARRVENMADAVIGRLQDEYGPRAEIEGMGDRQVKLTIQGKVPDGVRAELVEVPGSPEAGHLVLFVDKALIDGAENDLWLTEGYGLEWDEWDEGREMDLANFRPRIGPDGVKTPIKGDPTY